MIDADDTPDPPQPSQDLASLMDDLAQDIANGAKGEVSLEAKIDAFKALTGFYLGKRKIDGDGKTGKAGKSAFDAFKKEIHGLED